MPRIENPDLVLGENKFLGPFFLELARGNGASCARANPINLFSPKTKSGFLSEERGEIGLSLAGVELIINLTVH